jgi:hypothetical protein
MKLTRVTITGADNTTNPADMVALTKEFPFVEWGILYGTNTLSDPRPRFPDAEHIRALEDALLNVDGVLSAHMCGKYVRDLCISGNESALTGLGHYQRVQLNFHGQFHKAHPLLPEIINSHKNKRFILQCDGANDSGVVEICKTTLSGPLFDRSGGAGILPDSWPTAWPETFCGYAGGLSPWNVIGELEKIAVAAGDEQIWIDTETRVRTDDDKELDMELVGQFLEAASNFVWDGKS